MNDAGRTDSCREVERVDNATVIIWAATILLVLTLTEFATHQPRDESSHDAGYGAASRVADDPSARARPRLGASICDALFERATHTAEYRAIDRRDFYAGCMQAVRDANE